MSKKSKTNMKNQLMSIWITTLLLVLSYPTSVLALENQTVLSEGQKARFSGVLVPVPIWDHYQKSDLELEIYKKHSIDLERSTKKPDLSGVFLLVGVAMGVAVVSVANQDSQLGISFLMGGLVGMGLSAIF